MGACDDWRRKSSRNGDALVKSLQLKGDLALVVIHGHHSVKIPVKGLDEQNVGWERSVGVNPHLPCLFNGRRDYINLFPAALSALAAVRIQGCQGKPGLLNTGILKGNIGQSYGSHDGIHGQAVADLANRNMAGCPCGPQISQHIDFPKRLRVSKEMGHVMVLALKRTPGLNHCLLI